MRRGLFYIFLNIPGILYGILHIPILHIQKITIFHVSNFSWNIKHISTKNLNFFKSFLSFSSFCVVPATFFAGRAGSQFCQHITLLNFPLLIFVPSLMFIFIGHGGIFYRGQTGFGRFWDSSEIQCNFRSAAFKNFSLTYLAGWRGNIELAVKYETTFDRTLYLSVVFKIFLWVTNRHKSGLMCRRWKSILTRPIWNIEYKYLVWI